MKGSEIYTMRDDLQVNHYLGHVKCGRAIIHLLVILFGVSTWIGVNGIFIELPLLVNIAPEGWNLPAYIVIVAQSANVGPAIYTFLCKKKCELNESLCILCLLCLQILAMGLLIFFYNKTTVIDGEKHSLILLVSVFFNALVGCFSSVLFMPYLRDFDDIYIVSYFIGEGLSGVLPSIVALIQGVGECLECNTTEIISLNASHVKFPGQYYFLCLTFVLVLSLVAFIILRYSRFVQSRKNFHDPNFFTQTKVQLVDYKRHNEFDSSTNVWYIDQILPRKESEKTKCFTLKKANNLYVLKKIYLYVLIGICCFFSNGFLPSIQSYSCLPYGHLAYQLSITCAQFVNPLACFLTFWIKVSNIKNINCLSLVCLIAGCYVICIALLSPAPPLRRTTIGVGLIVLFWIILSGVISYLKLIIVSLLKHISSSNKALFNIGIVMQAGSASGAIISFVLINFTDIFKMYDSCSV
ncbi:solute carrier family 52, riboflavin transporter, member 3-A-like [Formica exsecta]|uniref:solute carrier family 52, riboflavin transporter, member 3-A-like n=1 Tax=Formica exsecta TaxID=72781 RepID=UPI001141F5A2|nr:solute carrier family 52, riboflavin transporter, member 3-A-like [Formica exsecta]XP_029664820.1 solute carrier family 52, riboflavin transporter, member 3-A-like [Formica exsecta]